MSNFGEKVLLRVYLQSADRDLHTPTYERIVQAARKEQLAGATVLMGILGAGYHGVIKPSTWSVAQHVPVIVEIVDSGDRIIHFVQHTLDKIMVGGMLTLERHRRHDVPRAGPGSRRWHTDRNGIGDRTESSVNRPPHRTGSPHEDQ